MRLWRIERTGETGYDEHISAVIRAESEQAARVIASEKLIFDSYHHPYGTPQAQWLDPGLVTCKPVEVEGEPGIVIDSFNAG